MPFVFQVRNELETIQVEAAGLRERAATELNDMEEAKLKMLAIREDTLTSMLKHQLKVLPQVRRIARFFFHIMLHEC